MAEYLSVGMKLHAMYGADGEFYPAEVASLSTSAKKKKTPVPGIPPISDSLKRFLFRIPKVVPNGWHILEMFDFAIWSQKIVWRSWGSGFKQFQHGAASFSISVQAGFSPQVKVHYIGYETTDDAWVSLDMLKCKALPKDKKAAARLQGHRNPQFNEPKNRCQALNCLFLWIAKMVV